MNRLTGIILTCFWVTPAFAAGGDFWTTTALHTVNLLILLYVLVKAAGPKITEAMAERSQSVGREITDAERRFAEAEERLSSYETKLEALETEASKLLEEYRELGERERDRIREEATRDAARIRTEANQLAARELESARASIEKDLVLSALEKAESDIKLRLTADDKQRLVAGYFGDLEAAVQSESATQSGGGTS
jgi:F-type H+-transporting ATPase subunit b